jgi:heme oxygenase
MRLQGQRQSPYQRQGVEYSPAAVTTALTCGFEGSNLGKQHLVKAGGVIGALQGEHGRQQLPQGGQQRRRGICEYAQR